MRITLAPEKYGTNSDRAALLELHDDFTNEMYNAVMLKLIEGYKGWCTAELMYSKDGKWESGAENFERHLQSLVTRRNWVGAANMAMFLWNLEQ